MAYADGELDDAEHEAERARVEAEMKADADVARRVEKHRAISARVKAHFDPVLDEAVPDRLVALLAPATAAPTVGGTPFASPTRVARLRVRWSWPEWGALAASVVVGVIIGGVALQSSESSVIALRDGHLVAQGRLAEALSGQLASTQAASAPVHIGTSFKAKDGSYCRTFVLHDGAAVGGLACRSGRDWNLDTVARAESSAGADGRYREAGSEMPAPVRAAIEAQIVGDPLDSSSEAQARDNGWK